MTPIKKLLLWRISWKKSPNRSLAPQPFHTSFEWNRSCMGDTLQTTWKVGNCYSDLSHHWLEVLNFPETACMFAQQSWETATFRDCIFNPLPSVMIQWPTKFLPYKLDPKSAITHLHDHSQYLSSTLGSVTSIIHQFEVSNWYPSFNQFFLSKSMNWILCI